MHPDGYIELRDRKKDIIICGGENISTIEVEQALCAHPAVLEAAVIAVPDDYWGEVPKAFVTLKPGAAVTEEELHRLLPRALAHFKCPTADRVRGATQDLDRQDPEVRAARSGVGRATTSASIRSCSSKETALSPLFGHNHAVTENAADALGRILV